MNSWSNIRSWPQTMSISRILFTLFSRPHLTVRAARVPMTFISCMNLLSLQPFRRLDDRLGVILTLEAQVAALTVIAAEDVF